MDSSPISTWCVDSNSSETNCASCLIKRLGETVNCTLRSDHEMIIGSSDLLALVVTVQGAER